jgi:diadenosine tetraphosphatase ApaH/serine/threonine PP2A family protein phosphatase
MTPHFIKWKLLMRIAVFSDVHSNLHALGSVLEDARGQGCDRFACAGDVVGYNAWPNECAEIVGGLACPVAQGNHDYRASADPPPDDFTPAAQAALDWTRRRLSPRWRDWLKALPARSRGRGFSLVHSPENDPPRWTYVREPAEAEAPLRRQKSSVRFSGHTHAPKAFSLDGTVRREPLTPLRLRPKARYLVDVGSVGQPRDGDPRAAYCVFDTDLKEIVLRRVEYDIGAAQKSVLEAGLPPRLAERLALGR